MAMASPSPRLSATLLAVLYSAALTHFLLPPPQDTHPHPHAHPALPSLPLRHSSLATLLPHIVYEAILISSLAHSSFASFGACLHLLKLPLLSTVYRYFRIGFKADICRSITFDLVNYLGQFVLFHFLCSPSAPTPSTPGDAQQQLLLDPAADDGPEESGRARRDMRTQRARIEERKTRNMLLMSLLTWILISLLDGLVSFLLERSLSARIETDVQAYLSKLRLDQYFLLKPSESAGPTDILRQFPAHDRPMIDHQLLAPAVTLPYFFSSAALISLPSDFILLDRLPMLSLHTKSLWLAGLVARRLLYSLIAWFLKN